MSLLDYYQKALDQLPCPAALEHVTINQLSTYAVSAGKKENPLVILLHGFPECWYGWREQIPALVEAGFHVLAPDLRGYGLNEKPTDISAYAIQFLTDDVKELIYSRNKKTASIVGHDWGGAVAWSFAMSYPKLIEKLIILNAPHPVTFSRELKNKKSEQYQMSWYIRFFKKLQLPEKLMLASPIETAKWFFQKKWLQSNIFSEFDLSLYAAIYNEPGAITSMLNWYRAAFHYRTGSKPIIKQIDSNTLVLWGMEDTVLSPALLKGLESWVPNLTIKKIENTGHFIQHEQPNLVNKNVIQFLNEQQDL